MTIIEKAKELATNAHKGQMRKGIQQEYIEHPKRVAEMLAILFPTNASLIAAGWCHDVLEDCPQVKERDLFDAIGFDAYAIVKEVTNPSKNFKHLSREDRKRMDREHLEHVSINAKRLKLVDRIDNINWHNGMEAMTKGFVCLYIKETMLLSRCFKNVDYTLEKKLVDTIEDVKRNFHIKYGEHIRD